MPELISDLLEIADRYDALLFDAYGVLVDDTRMIAGAGKIWSALEAKGIACTILTNGSARTLSETVASYAQKGLKVRPEQVINSASLLAAYFAANQLKGERVAVLGTRSSAAYVREAGGIVVDALREDFAALVVANQTEYPLLETLEAVLTTSLKRLDAGRSLHLVLTNPDLIYPKDGQGFGITAGSIALLLEQAIAARAGKGAPKFVGLGKPFAPIFEEAARRIGSRRLLMIGDQLETDIRGAKNFGIDSLLVGTGLTPEPLLFSPQIDPEPTYILRRWEA